jgi:hypothetical protein|tara:strand:- start:14002 stop:14223 length:222 start_codon:yes stop_codon:yes gene_type:complete
MEQSQENNCGQSDLIINLKTRNKVKFKAGAELSGQVNIVDIEYNDHHTEDEQIIDLKLHLKRNFCSDKEVVNS